MISQTAMRLIFWIPEKLSRYLMHERLTLIFFLARDPVSTLVTLMRVRHHWVLATSALVKTVMSEAMITDAHSRGTLLVAYTMTIAVLISTFVDAEASFLTEAIMVAIVALDTLRAVYSTEEWMTDANFRSIFSLEDLRGSDSVAVAISHADMHVLSVCDLGLQHG